MTMIEQTPTPAELPLLDVKDLAQRHVADLELALGPGEDAGTATART